MPIALFGIDGGVLSLVTSLLVMFLVIVYVALIYWTYLDARRRIEDPVLVACSTAASIFPFVGTVIYTILRPPEFLEDRQERELELRAAELRLRQLIEQSCPHCEYPIANNYLRCPNCERKLRNPCRKCRKPLDPKWGVCPFCETEVRKQRAERTGPDRERSRRRTARAAAGGSAPSGSRSASGSSSDGPTRRSSRAATAGGRSAGGRSQRPPSGGSSRSS